MIGNDVIDLVETRRESNWKRKGFLEKLFTEEEQDFIRRSQDPEITVWLFWSMKEAAYKIYNRETKIRAFIPKKLLCTIDSLNSNEASGKVYCDKNVYFTLSTLTSESIHTVAVSVIENISSVGEIINENITKDENGIPYLKTFANTLQDVSISHHGRFEKIVTLFKSPNP